MENKIKYGIVGLLSLLAIFGGKMYLTQNEVDNSYYCPSSGQWGLFYGRISSTGLTAYPYFENKTDYVRCTNSRWVLLKDYAKELGLNISQLIEQTPPQKVQGVWGTMYSCNQLNCQEVIPN